MHDFMGMPLNYHPCNWRLEFDSVDYVLHEAVKSAFCHDGADGPSARQQSSSAHPVPQH